MVNFFKKIMLVLSLSGFLFSAVSQAGEDGQKLYQSKCAMCHTVGKGRLVGPDLAGVSQRRSEQWLISFIQSSQKLIASGDKDAEIIFKEYGNMIMPDQDLNDAQVKAVLAYISEGSNTEAADNNDAEGSAVAAFTASKEDIELGSKLFQGHQRFENKGASCISCHHVKNDKVFSGGSLAVELTDSFERLQAAGLEGILKNIPFPAMKKAYEDKPLTDKEVVSLIAFLKNVSDEASVQANVSYGGKLLAYGIVGFFAFIFFLSIIGRSRKKGTVNKEIFDRQKY